MVVERTDECTDASDGDIATDVRRSRETTTRIVNLYEPKITHSRGRPARKLNWHQVIWQGGTVVAGDFNANGTRWGAS